jgi:6-phosphogluconate dehydrogenase
MGANMRERLRRHGHEVVGYARNRELADVGSVSALVKALPTPTRIVWVMVPAGDATESVIQELAGMMSKGDILIDGGNSNYKDSIRRAAEMEASGIRFLDCGTSGGIWGLEFGYCLMVGGRSDAFREVEPIFADLAAEKGYAHVGASGAGHYSKMVHNGIEYGMLQAYAEGFDLLEKSGMGYDLHQLAVLWNHGSVVRSWLLELAENAFKRDPKLEAIKGYVDDSGEGRWTVIDAVERGVAATVLAHSLFARFTSREEDSFAMRVIAALRNEFGGHAVKQQ